MDVISLSAFDLSLAASLLILLALTSVLGLPQIVLSEVALLTQIVIPVSQEYV